MTSNLISYLLIWFIGPENQCDGLWDDGLFLIKSRKAVTYSHKRTPPLCQKKWICLRDATLYATFPAAVRTFCGTVVVSVRGESYAADAFHV